MRIVHGDTQRRRALWCWLAMGAALTIAGLWQWLGLGVAMSALGMTMVASGLLAYAGLDR